MTKNLRHCLRFFSYILKQRETDIVYRAQNHSFLCAIFTQSIANRINTWYNSHVFNYYNEGKEIS